MTTSKQPKTHYSGSQMASFHQQGGLVPNQRDFSVNTDNSSPKFDNFNNILEPTNNRAIPTMPINIEDTGSDLANVKAQFFKRQNIRRFVSDGQFIAHGNGIPYGNDNNNSNNAHFYPVVTQYIRRTIKACDACRKKKIRCGPVNPNSNKCMNCTKKGIDCTFVFHSELKKKQKKKRKKKILKQTSSDKVVANENNISEVSTTDTDIGSDVIENKTYENNIIETEKKQEECSPIETNNIKIPKDIFLGLDKILRKVDTLDKVESITRESFDKTDIAKKLLQMDDQFLPKCHPRLYTTHIMTNYNFLWLNERIVPKPIKDKKHYETVLQNVGNVLKWYLIQYKKMINYLDFLEIDNDNGNYILSYYPQQKEQCLRIMENLNTSMMYTTTCIISESITTRLVNKVYNNEPMNLDEKLLFNVCLIAGIQDSLLISSQDDQLLRKDRYLPSTTEMKILESKLFTVINYYYNKIIVTAAGMDIVRALLLWARYCQCSISADVTSVIFSKAVSIAYHLGLHKHEYYYKFPFDEALLRKGIWKYFLLLDTALAVTLSKPPLINKSVQFSEVYSNEGFLQDVKRIVHSDAYKDCGIEINTFQDALKFTVSNVKYIVVAMSQYGAGLIELETKILQVCFNDLHIDKISFEKKIETCIEISNQLIEWRESLHPIMKLETFKEYYKLLSQQETRGNPALQYEVICSRILMYQFRHLSLTIKFCLFVISVIDDNIDIVNASKRKEFFLDLKKGMVTRYLDSSRKILKTFTSVKYQPFFYREVMHYFSTAVITLILHLVDHINDKSHDLENAYLLELLQTTYDHIDNSEYERPIGTYLKWNTALITLSTFLSEIIQYYHGKNVYTGLYSYKIKILEKNTRKYLEISTETAKEAIIELQDIFKKRKLQKRNSEVLLNDLNDSFLQLIETENLHITFFEKLPMRSSPDSNLNTSLYSIQNKDRPYPNSPEDNIFSFLNSGTNFYDRDFNFLSLFEEVNML